MTLPLVRNGDRNGDAAVESFKQMARDMVGRLGLKEAQALVRAVMSEEALERTGGSRRAAARLLGVTRRYVQLLLEEQARLGSSPWR